MNKVADFQFEVWQISDVFGENQIAGFIDDFDADRFVIAQTAAWGRHGLSFERRPAVGSSPEGQKDA